MRAALIFPAFSMACTLAACGDEAAKPAAETRLPPAGRVLGGEISDAMLPLDTVRSASPAGRTVIGGETPDISTASDDETDPRPPRQPRRPAAEPTATASEDAPPETPEP